MRKLILALLIVLFSAIYYFSNSGNSNVVKNSVSDFTALIKKSTNTKQEITHAPENTDGGLPAIEGELGLGGLAPEALKQWLNSESSALNSTQNNTEEQQLRFKAQALTLLPAQLQILRDFAVEPNGPINNRILSAYMITLNTSAESRDSLFDVAKSDLPDNGPILPHSEAEPKHTQELALRYMQIDELFERAKTDANARDKLKLLINEAQSAQVRSYAEKKLKLLK